MQGAKWLTGRTSCRIAPQSNRFLGLPRASRLAAGPASSHGTPSLGTAFTDGDQLTRGSEESDEFGSPASASRPRWLPDQRCHGKRPARDENSRAVTDARQSALSLLVRSSCAQCEADETCNLLLVELSSSGGPAIGVRTATEPMQGAEARDLSFWCQTGIGWLLQL